MCDPNVTIIALLNSNEALVELIEKRIWSPRLPDPAEYRPDVNGGGVSLSIRGGTNGLYDPIVEPSFQVTAWHVSSKLARAVQTAVCSVLHNLEDQIVDTADGEARVMTGVQEVYPQDVLDSDTEWNTCVSFYRLKMVLDLT